MQHSARQPITWQYFAAMQHSARPPIIFHFLSSFSYKEECFLFIFSSSKQVIIINLCPITTTKLSTIGELGRGEDSTPNYQLDWKTKKGGGLTTLSRFLLDQTKTSSQGLLPIISSKGSGSVAHTDFKGVGSNKRCNIKHFHIK